MPGNRAQRLLQTLPDLLFSSTDEDSRPSSPGRGSLGEEALIGSLDSARQSPSSVSGKKVLVYRAIPSYSMIWFISGRQQACPQEAREEPAECKPHLSSDFDWYFFGHVLIAVCVSS